MILCSLHNNIKFKQLNTVAYLAITVQTNTVWTCDIIVLIISLNSNTKSLKCVLQFFQCHKRGNWVIKHICFTLVLILMCSFPAHPSSVLALWPICRSTPSLHMGDGLRALTASQWIGEALRRSCLEACSLGTWFAGLLIPRFHQRDFTRDHPFGVEATHIKLCCSDMKKTWFERNCYFSFNEAESSYKRGKAGLRVQSEQVLLSCLARSSSCLLRPDFRHEANTSHIIPSNRELHLLSCIWEATGRGRSLLLHLALFPQPLAFKSS